MERNTVTQECGQRSGVKNKCKFTLPLANARHHMMIFIYFIYIYIPAVYTNLVHIGHPFSPHYQSCDFIVFLVNRCHVSWIVYLYDWLIFAVQLWQLIYFHCQCHERAHISFPTEHALASSARGPLECSDGPVVYAAPIKKHKRPFKRPEHIYNDIMAPDLPARGYHQDKDSVGDTSGNPEEALYSVVNVAESEVWCNVYIYIYIHIYIYMA